MRHADAVQLLTTSELASPSPQVWADLGCGDGTFTRALASVLAPGSTVHAMDLDSDALRALPAEQHGVSIRRWHGDVTEVPWPFGAIDGLLLANLLHYVRDQSAFLRHCGAALPEDGHLLVVEYDTDRANPWVPFPIDHAALAQLCLAAGFARVVGLSSRPSIYHRAPLYSVLVAKD